MDKRIGIVVLFSLTVAALASYIVYAMLVRHMGPAVSNGSIQAIVAARDLPLGSVIHESDLQVGSVSAHLAGAVTSAEEILGRGVANGIFKGEPILEARLTPKGGGGGLAGLIRPGMRAAAVRVNEVVGLSGFVRPGMHVDVITSGAPPDSSQRSVGTVSRIVLQDIEVLSADQDLGRDAEGKPVSVQVVNVLVTPQQAETLSLASEAKVQLILRNPLDKEITRTAGTNMAAMFNVAESRPARPTNTVYLARPVKQQPALKPLAETPRTVSVEVVNGSKREMVTLGADGLMNRGAAQ